MKQVQIKTILCKTTQVFNVTVINELKNMLNYCKFNDQYCYAGELRFEVTILDM